MLYLRYALDSECDAAGLHTRYFDEDTLGDLVTYLQSLC
jgi:hypothetical protein